MGNASFYNTLSQRADDFRSVVLWSRSIGLHNDASIGAMN